MSKKFITVEYSNGNRTDVRFYEHNNKGLMEAIKDLKLNKAQLNKRIQELEKSNEELAIDLQYYCDNCKKLEKAFFKSDAYELRCQLAGADETIYALRKKVERLEKQIKEKK